VPECSGLVPAVQPLLRPGDLVVVLGAGSIHEVADSLVRALSGSQSAFTMQ